MKIKSLLVANRGEIAIRVFETAKKLGIRTYAIKTSKEPNALYIKHADEVIDFSDHEDEIPEFLDVEAIVSAAKENKIDAIHPGYGYLSESPFFAQRCEEEGINFIGPSATAIHNMGNKTIAKQIAIKHKVPLLQGSAGSISSVKEALNVAHNVGYPIILKASSGGGGRGMRIVEKSSEMEKMYRLATTEAEKAFNDASVFIEKYVRNPRHIEFQILADKHGNVIHLGERECSVQRKHQKLIEECPSSPLDEKLRDKMGKASINMAKATDYVGVGTVEFLLDDNKDFFFMEMNTRIQVEHPVTELVTGLDLVEQQIKVAEGEKLSIKQSDVKLTGWAIECRINAEDVQAGFSPNLGIIEKISLPKGKNIRIDSGVEDGSVVTPYFDSMMMKLIVFEETREKAISTTLAALNKLHFKGIKTTIPFHKAVLNNANFKKGDFNTSFVEKELDKLYHEEKEDEMIAAFFSAQHYASEVEQQESTRIDGETSKNMDPWVLNKRLRTS